MTRGSYRTTCGARRRWYVKLVTSYGQRVVASADTQAQAQAALARAQARYPGRELVVVDTATTLAAAA